MLLLLADLSNSPAPDDVGFGINIRCKNPNLPHPLVSSCCRKEEKTSSKCLSYWRKSKRAFKSKDEKYSQGTSEVCHAGC